MCTAEEVKEKRRGVSLTPHHIVTTTLTPATTVAAQLVDATRLSIVGRRRRAHFGCLFNERMRIEIRKHILPPSLAPSLPFVRPELISVRVAMRRN